MPNEEIHSDVSEVTTKQANTTHRADRGILSSNRIDSAEKFLRGMAKILRDRKLYPKSHPQITAGITALHTLLQDMYIDRDHCVFVFIDDQVYIDDLLVSGELNQADIAHLFLDNQIEALTLHKGLILDELWRFLDYISHSEDEEKAPPLFHSPHITIGKLSIGKNGKKQVIPISKDQKVVVSRGRINQARYSEETKKLEDIYLDGKCLKNTLIGNIGTIMQTLETSLFANIKSFIPLGDLKSYDEYTYVHAINISILTMAQAEFLGYSKEAIHAFGVGAMLHDVGKTKIALEVLNKEGKLTEEEFEEMKSHSVRGAMLLLEFPEIPRVAAIVAYEHHLKYDGRGYPELKQKRPLHIASRLTSIGDQFDAMRSNRSYRSAMEPDKILEIMNSEKGKSIDPELFEKFLSLIKSRKMI